MMTPTQHNLAFIGIVAAVLGVIISIIGLIIEIKNNPK